MAKLQCKLLDFLLQVLEANVSLATLSESLQEMNFNREKKDFFNQETEQVLLKMQSSFKESFSQVRVNKHCEVLVSCSALSRNEGIHRNG